MLLNLLFGRGTNRRLVLSIVGVQYMDLSSTETEDSKLIIDSLRENIESVRKGEHPATNFTESTSEDKIRCR